jgi:hypothetical protein
MRRLRGVAVAFALTVLVACSSGDDGSVSSGPPAPGETTTTAPIGAITTTTAGGLFDGRRDVPPDGVPGQLDFLALTDGCAESPARAPSVTSTSDEVAIGASVLICVAGFDPRSAVAVQAVAPDGSARRHEVPAGDDNWLLATGPADPTGTYRIAAEQGSRRAGGSFTVVLPSSPFVATPEPAAGPPGTRFRFALVSPRPGQPVTLDLYGRENNRFVYAATLGSVTTDAQARASYVLSTAAGAQPGAYCLVGRPFASTCAAFDVG